MAHSTEASYPLLEQLQNELNHVLEQTGRVLAASTLDSKVVPLAQVSRLKQILPGSMDRFHYALDQLEDELQVAQRVMRRDLALLHPRGGVVEPAVVQRSTPEHVEPQLTDAAEEVSHQPEVKPPQPAEDVTMIDAEPAVPPESDNSADLASMKASPALGASTKDSAADSPPAEETNATETASEVKAVDIPLQIDTEPLPNAASTETNQPPDEEKQPDTADTGTFSNTNDFESLFGAPTSAGVGDAPDFNIDDANDNEDFDFGSFGDDANANTGGNDDSLSTLLPGLQDYANNSTEMSAEPDFTSLFTADMSGATDTHADGEVQLGDFMDFDDFGDGSFTAGNANGSGNNDNQDFDFAFG